MMQKTLRNLLIGASLLALAACDTTAFDSEIGASLDEGGFGNPTMNNVLVMSGQRDYHVNLANRFAAEVPSTVNFAFNSTALDGEATASLARQANWIKQFPELRFSVYGHTDLVGSNGYNKNLGLRRAQAVVNFLVAQGISRSRLQALVSYGETQPLVVTQDQERRNRRTVTEVSGFVQNHPSVLNGKYAEVIFREYVDSATRPHTPVQQSGAQLAQPAG
jgi:peptidoglycan-associated lipoprotein